MDNKLLKQHNAITTARYDMSSTEKNIVYMLLAQLKDDDPFDCIYKIQVKELEKSMNKELNYSHLKDTTRKLIKRVYTIEDPFKNEALHIGLLTAARYKKGGGTIELELSQHVHPYLFQLKNNFTTFQLHVALSLKSKFSKRIYEMLSQYKDTGIMKITVEELKCRLGLINLTTKEEHYKNFNDFEKRVLLVAKQELQPPIDISFTYSKHKTGTKVTDLVFLINYKAKKELYKDTIGNPSMVELESRLVNKFKLSPWQSQIILKVVPQQEINKTLYDISLKLPEGKIKNVGGFTARIFDNKYNLGLFPKDLRNNKN
jgi:plasmid replication initiation protein